MVKALSPSGRGEALFAWPYRRYGRRRRRVVSCRDCVVVAPVVVVVAVVAAWSRRDRERGGVLPCRDRDRGHGHGRGVVLS